MYFIRHSFVNVGHAELAQISNLRRLTVINKLIYNV
jgi:hypothetical protein